MFVLFVSKSQKWHIKWLKSARETQKEFLYWENHFAFTLHMVMKTI